MGNVDPEKSDPKITNPANIFNWRQ